MTKLIIRHAVEDYDRWKRIYDTHGTRRDSAGMRAAYVYRSADDGNDVTVICDFDSIEAARAFTSAADLKDAMKEMGVVGIPQAWFVEEA